MKTKKKLLILGSKEYPMGINEGYDLPSGGMEIYTENLVKHLKNKFDITIISAWFPNSKKIEIINGIKVYRVKRIAGKLIRGATFPLFSFFRALFMDFDIIISNGPVSSFFAKILSSIRGKDYIAIPHGSVQTQTEIPKTIRKLLRLVESFSYNGAEKLIFFTDEERTAMFMRHGFTQNTWVIPQGVDFNKFSKVKKKLEGYKTILFVGRLVKVKGLEYLIKALPSIHGKYLCIVVGDGPERESLQALAKKLKVNAEFVGFKNNVGDYFAKADVFVLPSLSEGFPITLLEAFASKTPVVITDLKLPITNKEAMLVSTHNSRSLSVAINKVFRDEELRNKLILNGYKYAKNHSFEKVSEQFEIVLKDIKHKTLFQKFVIWYTDLLEEMMGCDYI